MNFVEKRLRFGVLGDRLGELRLKLADDTLSEDESRELDQALVEFNELGEELTRADALEAADAKFKKANEGRGRLTGLLPVDGAEPATNGAIRSLGQAFAESEERTQMLERGARSSGRVSVPTRLLRPGMEQRTLIYSGSQPAHLVPDIVVPGIFKPRDYALTMRDVLLSGTTTGDTIYFLRELAFTNAAVEVAEATATTGATGSKPESALTFEEASAPVVTIAHWVPITRQMLADAPQVRDYLEGRLIVGLERRIDAQILNGNGTPPNMRGILATTGVQVLDATYWTGNPVTGAATGATANFNRIARAQRLIDTAGDAVATFIALNPLDLEKAKTGLDGTANYYSGGPFDMAAVTSIWGLPVVVNRNIAAGTALVGDGSMAQVWEREGANVLADTINDQFIRNMLTILAELRAALAVYRPVAFANVTLAAW